MHCDRFHEEGNYWDVVWERVQFNCQVNFEASKHKAAMVYRERLSCTPWQEKLVTRWDRLTKEWLHIVCVSSGHQGIWFHAIGSMNLDIIFISLCFLFNYLCNVSFTGFL